MSQEREERTSTKEYASLSEACPTSLPPLPSTSPVEEVAILQNVTKQSINKMAKLSTLRSALASVRASLTDSLCWERQLEAELVEAKAERKKWSELQTAIIIRQAELSGLVKRVPKHTSTTQPTYTRSSMPKADQMKEVLASLNKDERAAFIEELLSSITCKCQPSEPSGLPKGL
ncbi:MAG: hypothetical protein US20_C0026G0009 [Candidatus Pacebacteria bacterium GW2011_GWF1_36_5]|nr:MAG: hypothetical protein US20_C0026G0009 [Candidatus Pacebacteria bacterium GW2011_GWF1_36_5]